MLANRLRELRREKNWSQERLSEAAEMHRTYLAGIERAIRNPALENLVKLANAFDLSLSELFSFGPANEAPPRQGPRTSKDRTRK